MIRLAAASLSFDGFGDIDFEQTFTLAPLVGFSYLELNCWYAQNISARGVQSIRDRSTSVGLTPVSLHFTGPTGVDHKDVVKDLALGMRGIDVAKELGCGVFVTLGAPRGREGSFDALLRLIEYLLPYAEEVGITIALENHDGHALQNPDDYDQVFSRFDSPRLAVCADIGHFNASGVTNEVLIERLGDRIVHIHVKDNITLGTKRFVPFGEGEAKNAEFVAAMSERGYSGDVVVELSPGSVDFADREAHLEALTTAREMFAPFEKESR